MLEELPSLDAGEEVVLGEEVVVTAVHLSLSPRPRGRGDRKRQVGPPREEPLDERALSGSRGPGDDEELRRAAQRRSRPTSSAR
jgi:hypothetical protein